ncbi:MAG TPA: diguanylate cyclase [Acidimicrobiales bacterium]
MHVSPSRPELLGKDMTAEYEHLRTAVAGDIGVSQMVPSAAEAVPITAVAVPYDTPSGRRVFSGAFSPSTAPLGRFVDAVVPVGGGAGTLIDRAGNVLAGGSRLRPQTAFAGWPDGVFAYEAADGTAMTAAVASVDDTPWRVVLTAPTDGLHAPVEGAAAWMAWALLAALACFAIVTIGSLLRLGDARAEAALLSRTDMLTGLPNRRATTEALERAVAHSERSGEPLAVCLVDIDHFKSINDTYGHEAGDSVLAAVADALGLATRGEDLAGRWGGEEFLVVLSDADASGALAAAERIRTELGALHLSLPPDHRSLTVSIGVALLAGDDLPMTLVGRADAALYEAKSSGRNPVVLADDLHRASAGQAAALSAAP